MKLALILLFACLISVSAGNSYSQATKFTFSMKNGTVKDVIQKIEQNSEFIFVYYEMLLDPEKKIDINVDGVPIEVVLDKLLQGTAVTYVIVDRQIVFSPKKEPAPKNEITPVQLEPPKLKIRGTIKNGSTGEPMAGVNIQIEGTTEGTISRMDGNYSIMVPDSNSILVYSFIGYYTQKVKVSSHRTINISLSPSTTSLEEVQITAQGKGQKQAMLQQVNSNTIINVVAPDRLQENPDANATEAIGRLPGISVLRSGGEGTGLVIRGLEPKYSMISLNGIQLPSLDGLNRGTSISGISQYALQGVEVYKSLTADMDANSVAGTVNLKLREAPNNFHINLMAQGGYNQLNTYWGNYKFLAEFSNRFFNEKLGVLLTANAERVNRSIQTMSAGYGIQTSDPEGDILLSGIALNDITSIIYRRSVMLSIDYSVSPSTTLMFYSIYDNSKNDYENQAKTYGVFGAGSVGYSFSINPNAIGDIFQTSLTGETKLKFLNIKADYGISYSNGDNNNLDQKGWDFRFDHASTSAITDIAHRKMDPTEIVPLFKDDPDNFLSCWLATLSIKDSKIQDKNINYYLNITLPYKLGEHVLGNIKFGGLYRMKNRFRDDISGIQGTNYNGNQFSPAMLADSLPWIVRNSSNDISAVGFADKKVDNFLHGDYNFGYTFNIDRLKQVSDMWEKISDYYYALGPDVYLPIVGEIGKLGYIQNVSECMLNNQDIREKYIAGYLMSEININRFLMLLPGVRFENSHADMKGFYALPPVLGRPIIEALIGDKTKAKRSDQFILPMIHLRVNPTKTFYVHFAYTQTLSRPDFNSISPNYYVNVGWPPLQYIASNPELKSERWTNYDVQFTFHGNKIGLLSVTTFYKTVKDKIWQRSFQRIKGDPVIDPFPDNSTVDVTLWENHPYTVYVNGVEFEWQTSFYYLPKPFNFFTLYTNYTYTNSRTTYPYSRIDNVIPPGGGRPVTIRIDSTTTGPMLYQPKDIANISLGFNYKGFNAWLSYQYNGLIYTSKNYRSAPRLDMQRNHFSRWDLQLTQKFSIRKIKGFEVLANIANLSNFTEVQRLRGDKRPTYQENYGMTADLGLRYRF